MLSAGRKGFKLARGSLRAGRASSSSSVETSATAKAASTAPSGVHVLRPRKPLAHPGGFQLAHKEKLIRLDPSKPLELGNVAPTFAYDPTYSNLNIRPGAVLTPAAKALQNSAHLYRGLEAPWVAHVHHGSRWLDEVVGSGTFLTPICKDASGRNVRVIATAAHVCRDTAAIDIYVGTDLRVPGPQTVMEDSCCAPVLASWIAHTDAPKGALQEFITDPRGSELSPAFDSHAHGASRLQQQCVAHAPNAAFLTVAATRGLSASRRAPGRLHFTVPSVASQDFITLMGYPGRADPCAISTAYGHSFETADVLARAISQEVVPSGRLVVAPGALLGCDGRFLQTSASAVAGNSGSAVCPVDNPTHLLGVHIGGASDSPEPELEYNMATSVLHPLWALGYVQTVLPLLLDCSQWPSPDMPLQLARWLVHHRPMLIQHGSWEPCAKAFVAKHAGMLEHI